ncbi:hypothetical protein V5T82_03285 [Magnetovibrio sp. PR-2]|uniref:hypothetical protein n=1 Tax=Magnetovibrio sp. PR-2 TaxID=3120356 RepID=UPI002FCE62C7
MADIAGTSASSIVNSVTALRSISGARTAAAQSYSRPPDASQSTSSGSKIVISGDKAGSTIQASIYIGNNIVGMLKSLSNLLQVASSSQAFSYTNIHVGDGTRVSVVNASGDLGRTLERINELVEKAEVNGGNLLSSKSRDLTLKTTQFGGSLDVRTQPLDLKGLGLEDLNLFDEGGVENALAKIDIAISIAQSRVDTLSQLDNALNGTGGFSSAYDNFSATGRTELRGVLVNLYA